MFTDIVGYTAMMQQDEEAGMLRLRRYQRVLEEQVELHHGRVIQQYGDGSLTLFDSAVEAVGCAREIQRLLLQEPVVPLRTGIHIGDVVLDGPNVYGDGVNLASRVENLAVPGSILITERVIHDIRNHPEFQTVALGKFQLKNVDDLMEVYALTGEGLPVPRGGRFTADYAKGRRAQTARWKRFPLWIGLAAILLIGLGIWWLSKWGEEGGNINAAPPLSDNSIAVLPFRDFSPQGDQTYFSEGISEEILNALAQVEGLKVAGRTSSFSFKDKQADLREIGRQLGVSTVLEGSVRRADRRVRITAQLINTADGYHLWSQTYDRQLDDIFSVQNDIATSVVDQLKGILVDNRAQPVVEPLTANHEAYELYLRGRYLLSQRIDGAERAAQFFRDALALDPDFTHAYAGLGNTYLWMGWSNRMPSRQAFPRARTYARQALQRDTSMAYAQAILGAVELWYEWDWAEARRLLRRATQNNPSESRGFLDMGWYYLVGKDFEQARAYLQRAIDLDPLNLEYNIDLADMHRMGGETQKAREVVIAMQELYPNNSDIYWMQGMIAFQEKEYDAALEYFNQAVEQSGAETWALIHQAMGLAAAGRVEEARKMLGRLEREKQPKQTAPVELAMAYLYLGEEGRTLDLLETAYRQHANWMISIGADPIWTSLRENERFQKLVADMNFPIRSQ